MGVQALIYILCILKSYWISHLATLSLSVTWVLCVTCLWMTCKTQNNVQCYSQFLEREACALWEPGTLIVLDMCWFSNEVSWFDRILRGCWASCDTFFFVLFRYLFVLLDLSTSSWGVGRPTTFLGQFHGDPAGQAITCSRNHFLEMPDVPVSKIWPLWFYEYTSLPGEWDVISLSFFFFVFFQMPERVHKNVDWKQSPNLHSEAHSFLGSACQGESME